MLLQRTSMHYPGYATVEKRRSKKADVQTVWREQVVSDPAEKQFFFAGGVLPRGHRLQEDGDTRRMRLAVRGNAVACALV